MTTFVTKLKAHSLRIIVLTLFAITLIGLSNYAVSNSGGRTGGSTSGCSCHCTSSNNSTTVSITTSATIFEPGQTYNFTVTVSSTNGNASQAGVNVASATGTLTAGSDGLTKVGAELTHSTPKNLTASWDFTYAVPSSGTSATINAAGNAVNGNSQSGGGNCTDNWNTTTYTLTIAQRGVAITRSSIGFGTKRVGSSTVSDTLRIVSTGDLALTVSSSAMKNSTPFSATPTGANRSISAGQQEINTITFNPATRGTFVDTFVVNNNSSVSADQRKTVVVTGTAIQAVFGGATSLAFGNVDLNTSKDLTYTIQNTGDDTLFLNSTTPATVTGAGFTMLTPPALTTILPGGSTNLTVRFMPIAKQVYTGTLTFLTLNNIASPSVNLTGTGAAPQISVPPLLDVGSSKVGVQTFGTLNITNSGNSPLQVTSVTISGTHAAKFGISGSTSLTIQPAQTQTVSVSYTPNAEQRDTAQLTVTSNDELNPTKIIPLYGRGVRPKMAVSPDTIDFGDIRIGTSLNKNITITNSGEVNLAIAGVTVSPSVYTIVSQPNQIQPASSGQVTIKFTPTVEGAVTGMVIITGDAPATPSDTVYLKGKGTKSKIIYPNEINFGNIRVNQLEDSTITIENQGSAPVTIRKYSITGVDNGYQFMDTVPHTINANSSITFKVRFRPTQEKNYAGTITITTDEASSNTLTINLSGKGIDSKLIVEPNTLSFGEIDTMKTSATQSFTIKNGGTATATINSIVKTGSTTFTMNVDKTTPFTLAPDSLATVSVTFAPTLVQSESGTITVTASEGSPIEVALTGTGKEVTIISVSEKPSFRFAMSISPNPARENVTLAFTSERAAALTIIIVDMNGKLALKLNERISEGQNALHVMTNGLAQGMYLVRIYENGNLLEEENMAIIR